MNNYSNITFRYIKENKKRTIFTIIGLILSLSLISGVGFFAYSLRDVMLNRAMLQTGNYESVYYQISKQESEILKKDVDIDKIAIEGLKGHYKINNNSEASLSINTYNKEGLKDIFSTKVLEGRVPENSKEIMIDNRFKANNNIKIGDIINLKEFDSGEGLSYKIVGFYYPELASGNSYTGKTIGDDTLYDDRYNAYFSLIDTKNKVSLIYEKADNIKSKPTVQINNDLLSLSGQSSYAGINTAIIGMVSTVMIIIVLATVFLIYNFINISLAERMNQFGILRSVGATPKQIRHIVIKEGLIMCFMAIPFGILFGYLGVDVTIRILKDSLMNMLETKFEMGFYPQVLLITLILGIVTIFVATYGPAKKASKISPVDILKSNGKVNKYKEKYVKGNLIRIIFGIEGWIAYKNIRKNTRGFIVTILSLSISLVMFIVFNVLSIKQKEDLAYLNETAKFDYLTYTNREDSENMKNDIEKVAGVDKIYGKASMSVPILIDEKNYLGEAELDLYNKKVTANYRLITPSTMYYYSDVALNELGLSVDELGKDGVILINNRVVRNGNKIINSPITNYKVGDKIKIPKTLIGFNFDHNSEETYSYIDSDKFIKDITRDIEENNVYEVVVKKIIEKDILSVYAMPNFGMILPKDIYDDIDEKNHSTRVLGVSINKSNEVQIEDSLKEIESSLSSKYGYAFTNVYHEQERERDMWLIINTFIYGFIVMITLISVVNIISTISLNILLKKRELATLSAVGMDKGKINKMVLLEGVLYGIIASVLGGIVSIILVKVLIRMLANGFSITSRISVMPFIVAVVGVIGITLISSLIPLRRLRNISLVDAIRNEE